MKTFYKFLGPNGEAVNGVGSWYLPKKGNFGKWMPKIENPVLCQQGYHVCEKKNLLDWIKPDCWFVEVSGPEIVGDNKSVFQRARLTKKSSLDITALRLFAADCAERSLKFVKDDSNRAALERTILVVRAYAFGLATNVELYAARDEAYKVRRDADAADAADAAYAAYAAADADAAYAAYAAYAAADAAYADADAREAEKEWQTGRLAQYIHGKVKLVAFKKGVEKRFKAIKSGGVVR